jgi:restriction endonuclease Mrr
MPIPDYQSLMLPVLRQLSDRREHPVAEVRQRIAAE